MPRNENRGVLRIAGVTGQWNESARATPVRVIVPTKMD